MSQMPMVSPMRSAYYDATSNAFVVGDLRTSNPDVLREASRWTTGERGEIEQDLAVLAAADLTPFAREALGIGARVLAIAAQTSDTLAVQQAVKAATDQVSDAVLRASGAAEDAARRASEHITSTARGVHEALTTQVATLVGGEHPELLERLRPVLERVGTNLESQIGLALSNGVEAQRQDTERRHRELTALMGDVRRDVAVRIAEEVAAAEATSIIKGVTTIKGFDYETQVNAVCSEIAAHLGDEYRVTGETAGRLARNKKGDGVFFISGDLARVVVEMHDGASKEWGSYLAEAERNRGASASIGLVRHIEDNAGHLLRVIAPKRVVLAFDPAEDDIEVLRTVVLLMRTVALTSTGRFGVEEIGTVNESIREALALIAGLDEAKRSANAIHSHADKIESVVNRTMTSVQRELHTALNALTGASASIEAAPAEVGAGEPHAGDEPGEGQAGSAALSA
ncbi:hypothetical protein [Nocardioides sp. Leaf285]|uniref:hypothetical protein n=1 Tax=Nocardioides sp. Leaf285 TaxID=1736322 RepID=UPI0007032245|nr:hypothetical protein [Nocardioides sp. Leaf285]KQP63169.1 hypothetical protein ASF47_19355 [Nocardioides sp. Leaf285]